MDMKFKTRAFGGYDKSEVLFYINGVIKEYNGRLEAFVEKISELKLENSELKKQLSSEQAKAKIAALEAERQSLADRAEELTQALDQTREKLSVLADRIIELESSRLIENSGAHTCESSKPETRTERETDTEPETHTESSSVQKEPPADTPRLKTSETAPKSAHAAAAPEPRKSPHDDKPAARTRSAIIAALEQVEL